MSANGDSATIESIDPSAEQTTSVCPKGEAGELELSFMAGGNNYQRKTALYFECDPFYKVKVEVSPTFEISATHGAK